MATRTAGDSRLPYVLALDVGTSSVRAVCYDADGYAIEGIDARTQYQMDLKPDGGVEIDAERLVEIICTTIDQCLIRARALPGGRRPAICGVGYSNFWHAMLGVDKMGQAITPLYSWNDTRSSEDATSLAARVDPQWIHRRTGVIPHASYYPAKILWLRRTNPSLASNVHRWVSIGEYLYSRIFGQFVCSVSMASGTGLFNPSEIRWDEEMLEVVGLSVDQLSPLGEDNQGLTRMHDHYAKRWPELSEIPWLPAAGDGACSNIGSGCVTRDSVALNVGTSGAMRICWQEERLEAPRGLWFYRANSRYALLGGALSNGGDVFAWCRKSFKLQNIDDDSIEARIAGVRPDEHGLTVLPFFSGERSTGWHDSARASIIGLGLGTTDIEIMRASLESVCYRFASIYELLRSRLPEKNRIIASGGGILNSEVWTQMMADVMGVPVIASAVPEASRRGAAMLALAAFSHASSLESFPIPLGKVYDPDLTSHEIYLTGRIRHGKFYNLLVDGKTDSINQGERKE